MGLDEITAGRNEAVRDLALKSVRPDPKEQPVRQRKYRRKVASPKQWAAIRADKLDGRTGRICDDPLLETPEINLRSPWTAEELHHLVSRSTGGDDVADNLVGLCRMHHGRVTDRNPVTLRLLGENLTDAEYAYCVSKLGEGAFQRLFGVWSTGDRFPLGGTK